MPDVRTQLGDYLDHVVQRVDVDELLDRLRAGNPELVSSLEREQHLDLTPIADRSTNGALAADGETTDLGVLPEATPDDPGTGSRRRWPIAVVGVAAAAVLIIVSLLSQGDDADEEKISSDDKEQLDDEPLGVVEPGSWTVAGTFTDAMATQKLRSSVAAEVRSWPGVIDVVEVADPTEWRALTGLDGADCGDSDVAPPCGSGVAIFTVDSTMGQTALRLENEFEMATLTPTDVPEAFVEGYLDAAIESASPVPLEFDPSPLGVEQPLDGPYEGPYELESGSCEDPLCDAAVEVDVDGVVASAGIELWPSGGRVIHFGGDGQGSGYSVDDFLVDRLGSGGVLAEPPGTVSGRLVHRFGGLPLAAAVVSFELADGSTVWQRPLAGMAVIVDAPGSAVGFDEPPPVGPFVVLDATGTEIMRIAHTPDGPLIEDHRMGSAPAINTGPPGRTPSGARAEATNVVTLDGSPYQTSKLDGSPYRASTHAGFVETGDAVWLHTREEGGQSSVVVRIDIASGEVDHIPVNGNATTMVPTDDALWVNTLRDSGTVVRIDLESRTVTDTIEVSGGRSGRGIIAADGGLWVAQTAGLSRIDLVTHATETFPSVGERWIGEIDGGVWAFTGGDPAALTRVDLDTRTIERYELDRPCCPYETSWIAGDDSIWLHNSGRGGLSRFDLESREITDRLNFGRQREWSAGLITDQALWIASRGTITRIDAATAEVTDVITVEPGPGAVSVFADSLWVVHDEPGLVSRIDIATRQVTEVISVGDGPMAVAVEGAVWVAADDGTVTRIVIDS